MPIDSVLLAIGRTSKTYIYVYTYAICKYIRVIITETRCIRDTKEVENFSCVIGKK